MSPSEVPYPSIAIVGLGLIGGSIALGVRERWPQSRVFGVDSEAVLAHALGGGAIERGFESVAALPEASLIVLAAPVRQNIALLEEIGRGGRGLSASAEAPAPTTITDVGGTKRDIVSSARALPPALTFVGGCTGSTTARPTSTASPRPATRWRATRGTG